MVKSRGSGVTHPGSHLDSIWILLLSSCMTLASHVTSLSPSSEVCVWGAGGGHGGEVLVL